MPAQQPAQPDHQRWCLCVQLSAAGLALSDDQIKVICGMHRQAVDQAVGRAVTQAVAQTLEIEACVRPNISGHCYWAPTRRIENPTFGQAFTDYLGADSGDR